ncbi:glycosyl transferase [Chthonomonas calidirosea]|uniref:glycosyltransferase family 2 protein n=1 Tax=Chthonomonas calidirosea TaxID=454171 RepID=UPI0006DD3951|nr:glycosyltransferase family 2 protein [Chthonomonas calidirosea]CEK16901.1 glycosyl transferase [Chthonomonas calidirosea]
MTADSQKPTIICLTPVRNEAWILERILASTSLWADHIVIADQCSNDGSREIASRFPKVTLVDNSSPEWDEGVRQRLLWNEARKIPGRRLLFALDADEALTANWAESEEWRKAWSAPEGTVIYMDWVNIYPGFEQCWIPPHPIPRGFMDNGVEHSGEKIHGPLVPQPQSGHRIVWKEIKLLHFQYVNWERMKSKQRWYQAWERLNFPSKRPITLYRQYHHMDARPPQEMHPVQREWLEGYEQHGIDWRALQEESKAPYYWWDEEIVAMLLKHGTRKFRKIALWDVDWEEKARRMGLNVPPGLLADPRSTFEKKVHRWLAATQGRQYERKIRLLQRALRLFGW